MLSGRAAARVVAAHEEAPSGEIFAVCIDCGTRDGFKHPNIDAMSNTEARAWFEERSWTIKPTRCPACARAEKPVRE